MLIGRLGRDGSVQLRGDAQDARFGRSGLMSARAGRELQRRAACPDPSDTWDAATGLNPTDRGMRTSRRGRPRRRPDKLHADEGDDYHRCRCECRARSITSRAKQFSPKL